MRYEVHININSNSIVAIMAFVSSSWLCAQCFSRLYAGSYAQLCHCYWNL